MSRAGLVREVALKLVDLLERHDTPYTLMGGLVVPIWGIPRATYDIDVALSLDDAALPDFLSRARDVGFTIEPPYDRGYRDTLRDMQLLHMEWWTENSRRIEVDVFLVSTPYQRVAFQRRRRVKIDDRSAWVLDPADLILHKLVAARPKDLADIQNVLAVQGIPDEPYLREWAHRLGVEAALAEALARLGPAPP